VPPDQAADRGISPTASRKNLVAQLAGYRLVVHEASAHSDINSALSTLPLIRFVI
jgi:hypothetical protein